MEAKIETGRHNLKIKMDKDPSQDLLNVINGARGKPINIIW